MREVAAQRDAGKIAGHDLLKSHGITLVPVDAPNHFQDETPTATMVRSILGAVSQFEKEALVLKLRKARERERREMGRCEGNSAWTPVPAAHIEAARAAKDKGFSLCGPSLPNWPRKASRLVLVSRIEHRALLTC